MFEIWTLDLLCFGFCGLVFWGLAGVSHVVFVWGVVGRGCYIVVFCVWDLL